MIFKHQKLEEDDHENLILSHLNSHDGSEKSSTPFQKKKKNEEVKLQCNAFSDLNL